MVVGGGRSDQSKAAVAARSGALGCGACQSEHEDQTEKGLGCHGLVHIP